MITDIVITVLALSAGLAMIRLVRGPGPADRIVALDVILVALMGAIAVHAARTGSTVFLDGLVVIAIIGFTATVAVSRFVERDGRPTRSRRAP